MSFQFRFSTILAIREQLRDQAAANVATIQAELCEIDAKRRQLTATRQSLRDSMLQKRTQIISAQSIKSQQDYFITLQRDDDLLCEQQTKANQRLAMAKTVLHSRYREAAQMEKLHQRARTEYLTESKRAEQHEHDEIAITRHHDAGR